MPNHKSAEKRERQNSTRRLQNRAVIGKMRTAVKAARAAVGDAELVKTAVCLINRAVSRRALKRTTASRYISRLIRATNK